MNTNVLEPTRLRVWTAVRTKIPTETKLLARRNAGPSLAREGEDGVGRNVTLGAKVVHVTSPANVVP